MLQPLKLLQGMVCVVDISSGDKVESNCRYIMEEALHFPL